MKKLSKIFSILLAAALTMGLAACGDTDSSSSSKASTPASSSASSKASENPAVAKIKEKGTLTISLESGFAPFEYAEGDKVIGIDIDIAQYIADKWGVKLEVKDMAFDTALLEVSSGNVDMSLSGVSKTPERDTNMDFSDPYFSSNQVIVVKAGSDIKTKDDIKDKTVGVQGGTTGDLLATEFVGEKNVKQYEKYAVAIEDVKNGQIDCIIMDAYPAKAALRANEGKIQILDEPLGKDEYCVAVKEGASDLAKAVNEILKEMKDSNKIQEIIKKYEATLEDQR